MEADKEYIWFFLVVEKYFYQHKEMSLSCRVTCREYVTP